MYCIIHGKGAGHTSKMCPKVKKSIEETKEENKMSYSYGPVAIYDPNQWRQNQQQRNFQQL
jgi:hypothetical protein